MKIAYFADGNYPSHDVGWINYLSSDLGVESLVFLRSDSEYKRFDSSVQIIRRQPSFPVLNFASRLRLIRYYRKILKAHNVQLVHFLGGELKCQWGPFLDLPFIITTRGSDILEKLPRKYLNVKFRFSKNYLTEYLGAYFHKKAYKRASAITSTSQRQILAVKSFQAKSVPSVLVRTGCKIDEFYINELRHISAVNKVFSARTMKRICNQDIILHAFSRYLKIKPEARLSMIDNHPDSKWSKEVHQLAKDLGIENRVDFLPALTKSEMLQEYLTSDVCIMIPSSDGTPVSGVEAMLAGVPLILGAYDYDEDLFSGTGIWRLKSNDSESLFDGLRAINDMDPDALGQRLSIAQRLAIERADKKLEMGKIMKLYDRFIP